MNRISAIAKAEFLATVTRKGYIIAVIALPIVLLAVPAISYRVNSVRAKEQRVGMVDEAGLLGDASLDDLSAQFRGAAERSGAAQQGGLATFVRYDGAAKALEDVKQGTLDGAYVIPSHYLSSGELKAYGRQRGMVLQLAPPAFEQVSHIMRVRVAARALSGEALARVVEPVKLEEYRVNREGQVTPITNDLQKLASFVGPFASFLLFSLSIFLSANYLLQAAAEEKQNRVIEAVLSAVTPSELLMGKLLGLGAAALLQLSVYVLLLYLPAMLVFGSGDLTVAKLVASVLFFVLGFLLFAIIMATVGIVANSVQEASQMSLLWTAISVLPLLLFQPISNAPDALWVRALSVFPLTAPISMLLRINVSAVPTLDLILSAAMLVAAILLAWWGGAKVIRTASLLAGKRPTLPEILRWMREA